MGHERLGVLPKTKVWRLIVADMLGYANGEAQASLIAKKTLFQVQRQFTGLENDPSVKASFEFLIQVSHAFQHKDPLKYLTDNKILDKEEISLIKLGRAALNYKPDEVRSAEYQTFARQALIDALNNWYLNNKEIGKSLFSNSIDTKAVFYKASNGRGFCEISRLFFSKFTERYIKYFLEREASCVITNINDRNRFNNEIENHITDVSKHAFQMSKITQSFAAGWFNKHVKKSFPNEKEIYGFLAKAFAKMKDELLREQIN